MGSKLLFILNAIVVIVLGAALMFVPATALAQFGTETRVPELHMARFLGAALATLGLLLWFAKDASDPGVQKNMAFAMLGGTVLALIVTIIGVAFDGIIRNFGWLVIVIEVVFGLGYVFVIFLQPRMK
ncbi:MAG: hypothetical protein MHPDNHAH_02524 [Anaerolineales bacterium]|nr:hypothetical protein [Anaerolineales bacterium]